MVEVMNGQDKMSSEDLVKGLNEMADRPWATWKHGKPINQIQAARMVRGFDIKPTKIWFSDKEKALQGYYTQEVKDTLGRYAPETLFRIEHQGASPTDPEDSEAKINDNELKELEAIFLPDRSGRQKEAGAIDPEQRPGKVSATTDEDGFDWSKGSQQNDGGNGVEYMDGNGKIQHAGSMGEAWDKIIAEHATRKALQ